MGYLRDLIDRYDQTCNGDYEYGQSIRDILNAIPLDKVNLRVSDHGQSIAEIVRHIVKTRLFIIGHLEDSLEIEQLMNKDKVEKHGVVLNFTEWTRLVEMLKKTQDRIMILLGAKTDEWLQDVVGRGSIFQNEVMVTSLISHDLDHLGQIAKIHHSVMRDQKGTSQEVKELFVSV